jgi:hypothetical protein
MDFTEVTGIVRPPIAWHLHPAESTGSQDNLFHFTCRFSFTLSCIVGHFLAIDPDVFSGNSS